MVMTDKEVEIIEDVNWRYCLVKYMENSCWWSYYFKGIVLNQAMITGESVPVRDTVIGATNNIENFKWVRSLQ